MNKPKTLAEFAKRWVERQQLPHKLARGTTNQRLAARMLFARKGTQTRIYRASQKCKLLPLDQMRGLPRATEKSKRCAIYFLWQGPLLHYIGQSISVGTRLAQHRCTGKKFTHVTILRTPQECLRQIERQYIFYYLPPGNGAL